MYELDATSAMAGGGNWFLDGKKIIGLTVVCGPLKVMVHKGVHSRSVLLKFHGGRN